MAKTVIGQKTKMIGDVSLRDFLQHKDRLRVIGALSPVYAKVADRASIDQSEIVIGRDSKTDMPLLDESVSRRHARIYRSRSEFVIEDLGSSNGTYVNGVPVVSCVLHGGDRIQIGCHLFFFDRLLEFIETDPEPK